MTADAQGRYSVLLGANTTSGMPEEVFTSGEARWLGIQEQGQNEHSRSLLVSVPYALKAGDAETLGGLPASAYALAATGASSNNAVTSSRLTGGTSKKSSTAPKIAATVNTTGTTSANFVPKFTDSAGTVTNSTIFDGGTGVGIGTTTPGGALAIENGSPYGIVVGQNSGANPQQLLFGYNTAAGYGAISALQQGVAYKPLNLQPNGGNVGIGTTTPTGRLAIESGDPFGIVVGQNSGTNPRQLLFGYDIGGNYGSISAVEQGLAYRPLALQQNGGNVGIGTTTPASKLDAVGNSTNQIIRATQTNAGAGSFNVLSLPPAAIRGDTTATSNAVAGVLGTTPSQGGFGILGINTGTGSSTTGPFGIGVYGVSPSSTVGTGVWGEADANTGGTVGVYGKSVSNAGTGVIGQATATSGDAVGVYGTSSADGGTGLWGDVTATTGINYGVLGRVSSSSTSSAGGVFDTINAAGNILIGRSGANVTKVFRVDSTGKGFFNGGTQTGGADFAESVEVLGQTAQYEPGDLLIIDATGVRRLAISAKPYSTLVAGIYSTKPGILATPHGMDDPRIASSEVPLAVVGIVPCKVTAENGPIQVGDLLVSSSLAGHAMKGTDRKKMMGAVVGKALQSLKSGTGVIEVLVSLQ